MQVSYKLRGTHVRVGDGLGGAPGGASGSRGALWTQPPGAGRVAAPSSRDARRAQARRVLTGSPGASGGLRPLTGEERGYNAGPGEKGIGLSRAHRPPAAPPWAPTPSCRGRPPLPATLEEQPVILTGQSRLQNITRKYGVRKFCEMVACLGNVVSKRFLKQVHLQIPLGFTHMHSLGKLWCRPWASWGHCDLEKLKPSDSKSPSEPPLRP